MRRRRFLTELERFQQQFGVTEWITPTELTALAGWSRQRTHSIFKHTLIELRQLTIHDHKITKARIVDVLSLLRDNQ